MKLLFASDLHGSAYYAEKLEELIRNEAPDKTVLLGDLLYHGPRNDLPREYDPKKVTRISVHGNEHLQRLSDRGCPSRNQPCDQPPGYR